ncbi:hypothetical protein D3C77_584470 [compost metagenome]
MANQNKQFLSVIEEQAKDLILDSIAAHYVISRQEAYEEVVDEAAEHLLEYMIEPHRSAASVLMQSHGMR